MKNLRNTRVSAISAARMPSVKPLAGVAAAAATATPAKGFTLGLRAALMALSRVFRRFFLPYQPAS